MPTISPPATGQHAEVISGIYIARGTDTLGPYNSLEAAALVVGGYLRLDDYAARNGDPAWVSLTNFLPLSSVRRPVESTPASPGPTGKPHPHRWRRLAAAFAILLTTPLLVAGGVHWFGHQRTVVPTAISVPSQTAPVPDPPVVPAVVPVAHEAVPPPTSGPLNGSLSFTLPQTGQVSPAGVRVSAYPLAVLEPALGQEIADAQAARARLDTQIEAAAKERANRASEAQAALQALHEADPADPMFGSLRFSSQGAKAASKTAEEDYRYLLDERATAAGGDFYFHGLPVSEVAADTDAQGNFTLALPPGTDPYVVAASVRQTADDGVVRSRYWLLKLSPAQRAGRESVRLEDGNASSSSAVESLIHTAE